VQEVGEQRKKDFLGSFLSSVVNNNIQLVVPAVMLLHFAIRCNSLSLFSSSFAVQVVL
jgi:hypothetical protein